MRNWSNVFNKVNFQTCGLKRTDCCFAACARTFNHYFDSFHAMLHSRFSCGFSSHLCRERRALTGTFKAEVTRACPRNRVTVRICNRNDRIVECRADVRYATVNIFTVTTFRTYHFFWFSHVRLSLLLISSCSLQSGEDLYAYEHLFSCVDHEPEDHDGDEHHGSSRSRSDV